MKQIFVELKIFFRFSVWSHDEVFFFFLRELWEKPKSFVFEVFKGEKIWRDKNWEIFFEEEFKERNWKMKEKVYDGFIGNKKKNLFDFIFKVYKIEFNKNWPFMKWNWGYFLINYNSKKTGKIFLIFWNTMEN